MPVHKKGIVRRQKLLVMQCKYQPTRVVILIHIEKALINQIDIQWKFFSWTVWEFTFAMLAVPCLLLKSLIALPILYSMRAFTAVAATKLGFENKKD
jgi:hypothetical protein